MCVNFVRFHMAKQSKDIVSASKKIKRETIQNSNWCTSTFSTLLDDPSTHDVTFKTSDGGSVSCHRAIVAAGSPVFHAMLYGNMKESNEKEIELPSVDTETFKALLSFMYTGKIEIDSENCYNILEVAHYYNVTLLETISVDFISSLLTTENCCQMATLAKDKGLDMLLKKCLNFIFANAYNAVQHTSFNSLPSDLILMICKSSEVCIQEIDLFLAIVKWYEHQRIEVPKEEIQNIANEIRYPLISISDLIDKVRPVEIVDKDLYISALEYHHMPKKFSGPQSQLERRKWPKNNQFQFITISANMATHNNDDGSVTISRVSGSGWNGMCAARVHPTVQNPIYFKTRHIGDSSCIFSLGSCPSNHLLHFNRYKPSGIEVANFTGEINCLISSDENNIYATIGSSKSSVTKEHNEFYLCVYLYHAGDTVTIV